MPHDTPRERRQPRIDVHELRRDLRDADQDRFHLRTELNRHRTERGRTTPRLLSLMVLIAGGLTSALWMTLPAQRQATGSQPTAPASPSAAEATQVADSTVARDFVLPVESNPIEPTRVATARPRTRSGGATSGRNRGNEIARKTAVRARAVKRDARQASTTSDRRHEGRDDRGRNAEGKARRQRPRPLSPGEFGRTATTL